MASSGGLRILVGVKRVVDYAVKVRVNSAKTAVETANVKMSMNPFCEIATEEALKLKDSGFASEVIALTIGPKSSLDTLRTALAMGCDRGIHIETDMRTDQEVQPLTVAKTIANLANQVKADIIFVGKQSIDDDSNQTGQMTAGKLGWPQATFASKVVVNSDKKSVTVTREMDGGLQTVQLATPCVISADLRLNTPRYATLPNIMKAKKKPVETKSLSSIVEGKDLQPRLKVLSVTEPSTRKAGKKVENVDQLIDKLKNEAKVI